MRVLLSKVFRLPVWLLSTAVAVAIFLFPAQGTAASPADRVVRIEAARFAFTPAQVRVNPGDRVTLEVVATDVAHGVHIDDYNLEVFAEPGQTARLTFVADRPGMFRLRCSVTCGPLHPFMLGKLRVGHNWLLIKALLATAGVGVLALVSRSAGKREVYA